MRDVANIFLLGFFLLQAACTERERVVERSVFKSPQVVEAKSNKIQLRSTNAPTVLRASGVKRYPVTEPEILHLKANIFPAIPARTIAARSPEIFLASGKNVEAPKVFPAISNRIVAGQPEVILIKEPLIKENNPESFSLINAIHGLHSNEISSLLQDKDGNLWIGAWWGGVSKYDGKYLTNYTVAQGLSSDEVSCVFEDKSGNLWIGTIVNGVNKFDGKYITRYSSAEGLSHNYVYCMLEDKQGNMWFGTEGGLNKYDGRSFTHYTTAQGLPTNSVHSLLEDKNGNL